jgi:glyoxylase-like metal-dependent hydrolase (beta-lactamase superfamily II)
MEEGLRAELKSKKLVMGPEDHADIIAWMRALRGWNKTRKIYEINPYVEVYQFRDNTYGLFSYNCDAAGDPWMYLIVGPEKAMLLDTAFGLGDTKALVDKLSGGKPLVVVNSHAHPDHAFGNCRFDTVYCHEYSVWDLETQDEHLWDYLFDENGNNRWLAFDRKDLPIFKKYKIIGVPDGYVFNLGGDYEVELKWVPGHASGHAMFLDRKGRILYAGDGLCAHISGEGSGKKPGDPYWKYNNMEALMIFRLLQGTGQAFTATCFLALAADTLPANKFGAGIGIFSMAQAASQAIGPTVALTMVDFLGYKATFATGGCIMVAAALIASRIEIKFEKTRAFKISLENVVAKEAVLPAVILFFLAMTNCVINSFLIIFAGIQEVGNIGYYFTVYAGTMLFTRPLVGRAVDRFGLIKVIIPAMFCFAFAFIA